MTARAPECVRETQVLNALDAHFDDELLAHVSSCVTCTDLVAVAHAILDDASAIALDAPIPSSGGVWWRIERRSREEAALKAARTVNAVQVGTVAIAALLAVILLGGMPAIRGWGADLAVAIPLVEWAPPMLLGVATLLILTPVAIYYALTEE